VNVSIHGVYVVTDRYLRPGREHAEVARVAVAGGACMIQVRDKKATREEMLEHARAVLRVVAGRCPVIINDWPDVAAEAGAEGAHVGQDDTPLDEARAALGEEGILGVSVHTAEEARRAEQAGADYLGVGAMFPTATKDDAKCRGLEQISRIRAASTLPIVAIGGINASNIAEVAATGADAAAVVSAVACADDMEAAVRELVARFATSVAT